MEGWRPLCSSIRFITACLCSYGCIAHTWHHCCSLFSALPSLSPICILPLCLFFLCPAPLTPPPPVSSEPCWPPQPLPRLAGGHQQQAHHREPHECRYSMQAGRHVQTWVGGWKDSRAGVQAGTVGTLLLPGILSCLLLLLPPPPPLLLRCQVSPAVLCCHQRQ